MGKELTSEEAKAQISALKKQAKYLATQNENLSQNNKALKQKVDICQYFGHKKLNFVVLPI